MKYIIFGIWGCVYSLIVCIFALVIIQRREDECEMINRQDFMDILLWPLTILFWLVTKIHNFVHK